MTNMIAIWTGRVDDIDVREREAERQWSWILDRWQIGDCLETPSNCRSIASHWKRFLDSRPTPYNPHTFLLKDLAALVAEFDEYLDSKHKSFPELDVYPFVAWKIWVEKINAARIFSPEIHPLVNKWSVTMTQIEAMYQSVSRARKLRRKDIAEQIALRFEPAFETQDEDTKQAVIAKYADEIKALIEIDDKEILDAVRSIAIETFGKPDALLAGSRVVPMFAQTEDGDVV